MVAYFMVDLLYFFMSDFPHAAVFVASAELSVPWSGKGRTLNFLHITLLLPHLRNSPPEALEVLVERDNRTSRRYGGNDFAWSACLRVVLSMGQRASAGGRDVACLV